MGAVGVVNHVGLCVTDLERSRRFYEELLGFTFRNELKVPDGLVSRLLRVSVPVGLTAVYLELEGFTLELIHFDRPDNHPQRDRHFTEPGLTHLSFCVRDLPYTIDRVPVFGGEVLEDTNMGGQAVMVRDPDGQLLELMPMSYLKRDDQPG